MKNKFLLLIIPILVIFFIPKSVFAQSITPNKTQIYWQAHPITDSSDVQSSSFDALQNNFYLWGSSFADFKLIRNGLLVNYTSLGSSTYQYKVRFYIATNSKSIGINNLSCSLWSPDIYNQSCSVDGFGITTDISGGGGFTTHYVDISYNFSTYGSDYVEFWINYNNMTLTPKLTKFAYKLLSFEGQINPTSIIVDQNTTIINQNNETNNKLDTTNDNLNNIDDTLKNEDISDIDFSLSGIVQSSDTPVSDMVLLPITLLNKLNDNTSSACSSWFMPFDFQGGNNVLELPCIKLEKYLGSDLVGIIDDFICIFMTWSIIMSFVSFFNDITGLRDTYDSMYQPKHSYTGYKPKHGKE